MKYPTRITLTSRKEVEKILRKYEELGLGELYKMLDDHSFIYVFKDKESMKKGYEILKQIVFPHRQEHG